MIRELRAEISLLRDNLTKEVGPGGSAPTSMKEVSRLEAMIADLQVAKQQTWEEKERLSEMYEEERHKNMASKACDTYDVDRLKHHQCIHCQM